MESFKEERFRSANGDQPFVRVTPLPALEVAELRTKLRRQRGLGDGASDVEIATAMRQRQEAVGTLGRPADLRAVLGESIPTPLSSDVYIAWSGCSCFDRIEWDDLLGLFEYVWYPSIDDIDLFDDSLGWFLSVDHDGMVFLRS